MEKKPVDVMIAEDGDDDFEKFMHCVQEIGIPNRFQRARNAEELIEYLEHPEKSEHPRFRPMFIILDLNQDRVARNRALQSLKEDPVFKKIPVVVLSGSEGAGDVSESYDLGATSCIQKPQTLEEFKVMLESMYQYWCSIVKLPTTD